MRNFIIGILSILSLSCQGQNKELEYRSTEYYFDQIAELVYKELVNQKIVVDSLTIADEYLDKETKSLNEKGFEKYAEIKMNIYQSFFNDYLYQQHISYKDKVYVLYFTVAGFDDIEWNIVEWPNEKWKNEEKLSREKLDTDSTITKLFWNYDEGPKNMENVKIFIQNNYLVFERGNLYHSLYDLKANELLINEESPWFASNAEDKEKMNEWIKTNLHNKIEQKINQERK